MINNCRRNEMNNNKNNNDSLEYLNGITKQDEFNVPEGYFDQLKDDIIAQTSESNVVSYGKRFQYYTWAVSLAAAIIIGLIVYNTDPTVKKCKTFACLLEQTTVTNEDIQVLEDDNEGGLFDDDELF